MYGFSDFSLMVKWKQSGKVDFFEKNLRIQVDVIFGFWVEWWYLIGGRLSYAIWWWVMAILKSEIFAKATAYAKIVFEDFQIAIIHHQMALESGK